MRHTWLSLTCRWGVPHVNPRNLVNNVRESSYGGDEDREPHIEAQPCFPLFAIYFHCSVRTHIPNDSVGARYPGIEEEGQSCRWSCPDESCAHCVMPAIGQVWLTGRALEITSTHQAHETKPKRGRRAAACICVRVWEAGASLPSMWFNEMVGVVSDVMLL